MISVKEDTPSSAGRFNTMYILYFQGETPTKHVWRKPWSITLRKPYLGSSLKHKILEEEHPYDGENSQLVELKPEFLLIVSSPNKVGKAQIYNPRLASFPLTMATPIQKKKKPSYLQKPRLNKTLHKNFPKTFLKTEDKVKLCGSLEESTSSYLKIKLCCQ